MAYSYNPGVTDRSGELLAQGISTAGQAVAGSIDKWKQQREENQFMSASVEMLAGKYPNLVTPELLEKFESGSAGAKRGIFTSLLTQAKTEEEKAQQEQQAKEWDRRNPQFGSAGTAEVDLGSAGTVLIDRATGQKLGVRTSQDMAKWEKIGEDDLTAQYAGPDGVRLLQKPAQRGASTAATPDPETLQRFQDMGLELEAVRVGGATLRRPPPAKKAPNLLPMMDENGDLEKFIAAPDNWIIDPTTNKPTAVPPGMSKLAFREKLAQQAKAQEPTPADRLRSLGDRLLKRQP